MVFENTTLPLRGVIFDCDGVIIDSKEANTTFYNSVLHHFGLPSMTPEQEEYSFMATAHQSLEFITPRELHDQLDHVCRTVVRYADVAPLIRLQDGFLDFVAMLHSRNIFLGIHTNRTALGMRVIQDRFSLPSYFSPVVTADMMAPKPSAEGVHYITRSWDVPSEQILFVGDSENDRCAAEGGGVMFASFGNVSLRGNIRAKSYQELTRCLRESFTII